MELEGSGACAAAESDCDTPWARSGAEELEDNDDGSTAAAGLEMLTGVETIVAVLVVNPLELFGARVACFGWRCLLELDRSGTTEVAKDPFPGIPALTVP